MHGTANFYTIWSHRSAKSIFGASSHPVNRDGWILSFETEKDAQAECDRLNAGLSKLIFTEEQLTEMRGGLSAGEYRLKTIRKWQASD